MDPRLAHLSEPQHGLFTTAQALSCDYSAAEIARLWRTGHWSRLRRGIYIESGMLLDDPVERHIAMTRAVSLRLGARFCASNLTAAAVHRLTLFEPDFSLVNVTNPSLASSRIEAGVHHHIGHVPPSHLVTVDALGVTAVAWSIVDMSREVSFEQGVVTAEAALWAKRTTPADLRAALLGMRDWPGSRNAGHVVSFASTGSESVGESLARIAFEQIGLPTPEQQVEFRDRTGLIGFGDFFWRAFGTIGEFDGRLKYEGESSTLSTLYAEKRREDRLRDAGFEVVRFGWNDVRFGQAELGRRIRAAFARSSRTTASGPIADFRARA